MTEETPPKFGDVLVGERVGKRGREFATMLVIGRDPEGRTPWNSIGFLLAEQNSTWVSNGAFMDNGSKRVVHVYSNPNGTWWKIKRDFDE